MESGRVHNQTDTLARLYLAIKCRFHCYANIQRAKAQFVMKLQKQRDSSGLCKSLASFLTWWSPFTVTLKRYFKGHFNHLALHLGFRADNGHSPLPPSVLDRRASFKGWRQAKFFWSCGNPIQGREKAKSIQSSVGGDKRSELSWSQG